MPDNTSPESLQALMESAIGGSEDHARKFFEALTSFPLLVPTLNQPFPMSGVASPPNSLSDILGLELKDQDGKSYVTVPCFFSKEGAKSWAQRDIQLRSLTLTKLTSILPEGWWVVLEPGAEVEKELSPWEISLLTTNPPQIDEVVSELFSGTEDSLLEVRCVVENEYPELFKAIIEYAKRDKDLQTLYIIRDEIYLYFGAIVQKPLEEDRKKEISTSLRDIISLSLIGSDPWRLTLGESLEESPSLALFRGIEPVYTKI